jgi:hypothetical protein
LKPLNLKYRLHKTDILIKLYDYKNALKELKFMETIDVDNPEIYAYESMCYYSINDYNNSLKFANNNLKIIAHNSIFRKIFSEDNNGYLK